jgi:hypothetical protein
MAGPCHIDSDAIYDDRSVCSLLGLRREHLSRARRCGELRASRVGGKHFYVGSWLLDWLKADGARRGEAAPCP